MGFSPCWTARPWTVAWPLESGGKRLEVDHRAKAYIVSPTQRRILPIPGKLVHPRTLSTGFCSKNALSIGVQSKISMQLGSHPAQRRSLLFDAASVKTIASIFLSHIRISVHPGKTCSSAMPGTPILFEHMGRRIIRLQKLCQCSLRARTRIQKSAKFIGQPMGFNAGRVSDTEVASDAQTRNFNSLKMSVKPEILRHRPARYKAHSESCSHRRLDGFDRIQFHHNA